MRVAGLLGSFVVLAGTGCGQFPICPPQHTANPSARMRELLNGSNNDPDRSVEEEWLRAWYNDGFELNPQRIHGGIQ